MKSFNVLAVAFLALLIGAGACHPHHQTNSDAFTEGAGQAESSTMNVQAVQASGDEQVGTAQGNDRQQRMMEMCPMHEGTTRQLVKLDDGVAMEFTTTGDVDGLRQRVDRMAERREQMYGEHDHMHGRQDGQGRQGRMTDEQRRMRQQMMEIMSDATVETEEIDDGMRMMIIPKDAEQVDRLYEMMENHSKMMDESGRCSMM